MDPLPGDIIAYGGSSHEDWSARIIDAGELLLSGDDSRIHYSHVALYLNPGRQIESIFPFTRMSDIDISRNYVILRYAGLTDYQRSKIMDFARSKLGGWMHPSTWYNLVYILTFGLWRFGGQEVCSLLAMDAYAAGDIKIDGFRPDNIVNNQKFKIIDTWSPI